MKYAFSMQGLTRLRPCMENAYFIDLWCCLALLKLRQTAPCFCCLLHILIAQAVGQ